MSAGTSARPLDTDARARAQREFDRPLVIEAGAGTGKTAVLTARVVAWSLGRGWQGVADARSEAGLDSSPEAIARSVLGGIAAITFTEAAAAEMAVRIESALAGVESGASEPWLDESALPALAERTPRARALREALDHLTVRTIHAWCRSLLARFPIAAGLHPGFEVDATGRIQAEVLQHVLERRLRVDYADEAGGPLLELAELEQGPTKVLQAANALIDEGVLARELAGEPLPADRVEALLHELRESLDALAAHARPESKLRPTQDEVFELLGRTRERLDRLEPMDAADLASLDALAAAVRDDWAERIDQLKDWARGNRLTQLCKKLGVDEAEFAAVAARAHAALDVLIRLHPRRLAAAHRALRGLLADFENGMARRSAVTYSGLLRGARDLLVEHPSIASQLRRELDLLLVDEFQDTDALQCDLVRTLGLEGDADGRPSLFVVGDPKQSIYGWRNADLVAYEAFVAATEAAGGAKLALNVNFRSVPPVLAEVERAIAPVMREAAGVQPPFEALLACDPLREQPGFESADREGDSGRGWAPVEHWVSWERSDEGEQPAATSARRASEIEARAFARDVARLRAERGVALRDVALLLRSRSDLELYLHALREADVRYVVSGERSYFERREVIDAIAGLRCVLDPNDHVALLALVRSAAVGVPDAALIPLWSGEFPHLAGRLHPNRPLVLEELAALVRRVAAELPTDVPGIERIAGWEDSLLATLAAVSRLRESFEQDTPDRFVERLRIELAIETSEAGRFPAAFRLANLERFYRELAFELAAGADQHALLRRLRGAADREREVDEPVAAVEDAVQVMTIHGAKGLGFGHVYVAQTHKGARAGGAPDRVERAEGRLEYRLLGAETLGCAAAQARRALRERAEEVRTLYVALTRARERLVVMGARSLRGPVSLAASRSMADLLSHRRETPDLAAAMAELAADGRSVCRSDGASWRFPGLEPSDEAAPGAGRDSLEWPDEAALRARWQPVAAARAGASLRMRRPRTAAASRASHVALRDAEAERGFELADAPETRARGTSDRQAAMAAGTAVHALLEDWDLAAPPDDELARQRARLPGVLASLGAPVQDGSASDAETILDAFATSDLFRRFTALGDRVVARELPVCVPVHGPVDEPVDEPGRGDPASEAAPIECVVGAIDLVYRDDEGRLVVVDYKSDRVESPEALEARAARYAPQGEIYLRALSEGLSPPEPPRFELWFLRSGTAVRPFD